MLHILQCGLADFHSHYYLEALAQIAACRALDIDLKLYANCAAPEPILAETGAVPLFRDIPDALIQIDPMIDHLVTFITGGERFAADCAGLTAGVGPDDTVFVPHARIRHLHGLATWLATLPPAGRPIVALRFDDPDEGWVDPAVPGTFKDMYAFTRFAMAELLGLIAGPRLRLFATTPALERIVAGITGHACTRVPLAKFYPPVEEMAAMRGPPRDGPPHICVAGQFRAEKGAELTPAVVARFARRFPGASVSLQVDQEQQAAAVRTFFEARGLTVTLNLQVGECSRQDHYARLLTADIVLMPYAQQRYVVRASGIFAEAVACGLPVVVPAPTWMSRQVELGRAAGTSFAAFTAEAVADALIAATENLAELTAQARARQAAWLAQENVLEAIGLMMKAAPA